MAGKSTVAQQFRRSAEPHVTPPNFSEASVPEPWSLLVSAKSGSGNAHAGQTAHQEGRVSSRQPRRRQVPGAPCCFPRTWPTILTLQHPRCVFQLLKQQYSRYTPEMVERITGIPKDQLLKAYDLFTSIRKDGDTKKVATIIYAVGGRSIRFGTQIIRTAAMTQLLLGNVGRAGGGVNALRGHSNIQGATDMAGIFDILPGYLKMPNPNDTDLATYMKRTTPTASKPGVWDSFNYWSNTPKFVVSMLEVVLWRRGDKTERFRV